jgi:hypothetical protein
MFYIEMITILFLHKRLIEIVQFPHVLYPKDIQEMYLEKTTQILTSCNTCGATFFVHCPHCFNAIFIWKQHESFYQHNLRKKHTNPSILLSLRCSEDNYRVEKQGNI